MNLCCWSVLVWLALGVSLIASDSVIEEVSDRQLEKMVEENDFVAVAWFTKNCKYVFTLAQMGSFKKCPNIRCQ